MPCKFTYRDRTNTLVPHERGKHVCPLLYPTPTGDVCPIDDPHWAKGGCATTVATGAGARVRVQLDRDSADYKAIYAQRTMPERINSQAKELGIERPKLRNQRAITNANTLIYVLINLRVYQRIRARQSAARPEVVPPMTSEFLAAHAADAPAGTDCLGERHVDTWSARGRACGAPHLNRLSHPGCHEHQRGMIPCPRNRPHAPIQAAAGR
jgi:hypothetical protein